jgi:nitrate/nitrite-specific signal transduction histidine kinase
MEVSLHQTTGPSRVDRNPWYRVELEMRDDGCGFDPSVVPPDHLGLGIIRDRVQAIGASFELAIQPGHAIKVFVAWEGAQ